MRFHRAGHVSIPIKISPTVITEINQCIQRRSGNLRTSRRVRTGMVVPSKTVSGSACCRTRHQRVESISFKAADDPAAAEPAVESGLA